MNIKKIAEEEFQKLPLKEKQKFVSVIQTWNEAFERGFNYANKTETVEEIGADDRFEITEEGKEYLSGH